MHHYVPSFREHLCHCGWLSLHSLQAHSHISSFITRLSSKILAKNRNSLKAQWKQSYFTFWCAENGLVPTINTYCDFSAIFTFNVTDKKCNLQCPQLKLHNTIFWGVFNFNLDLDLDPESHNLTLDRLAATLVCFSWWMQVVGNSNDSINLVFCWNSIALVLRIP